jgi:glycosyltransferase involved in cell wall biosynthesis
MFHTNPYAALAGRLANAPIRLGSMREHYQGLPSGKWLRWIGCRGLDALITNSGETTRQVEKSNVTRARVHTVPNGVPIPEPVGYAERCDLKMQLGFSKTDILIGSIGRLDENKNYSMLLEAVVTLTNDWPNLRLIIIGEGPMKSQLLDTAHKLKIANKLKLPGKIPQAARFLHAMDVCCLTSHTEGMPNLVMEAAAAGLPVVSTRCGDTAELIDHGRSGFLVGDGDSSGMAGYLKTLISQPEQRREMGYAARERMRRDFSIGTMVKRMTGIYEQMLGAKGLT